MIKNKISTKNWLIASIVVVLLIGVWLLHDSIKMEQAANNPSLGHALISPQELKAQLTEQQSTQDLSRATPSTLAATKPHATPTVASVPTTNPPTLPTVELPKPTVTTPPVAEPAAITPSTDTTSPATAPANPAPSPTETPPTVVKKTAPLPTKVSKPSAVSTVNTHTPYAADQQELLAAKPSAYTLQLLASNNIKTLNKFISLHKLKNTRIFHSYHQGQDWYTLTYGIFETVAQAKSARNNLAAPLRAQAPWVRPLASVQAAIKAPASR